MFQSKPMCVHKSLTAKPHHFYNSWQGQHPITASLPPCADRQAPINLLFQHTQADLSTRPPSHPSSLALWPYPYIRQLVKEPSDPDWFLSYTMARCWRWQGKINVGTDMRKQIISLIVIYLVCHCHVTDALFFNEFGHRTSRQSFWQESQSLNLRP